MARIVFVVVFLLCSIDRSTVASDESATSAQENATEIQFENLPAASVLHSSGHHRQRSVQRHIDEPLRQHRIKPRYSLTTRRAYTRKSKIYDFTNKYKCKPDHRDLMSILAALHRSASGGDAVVRFCSESTNANHIKLLG